MIYPQKFGCGCGGYERINLGSMLQANQFLQPKGTPGVQASISPSQQGQKGSQGRAAAAAQRGILAAKPPLAPQPPNKPMQVCPDAEPRSVCCTPVCNSST